MPGGCSTCGFDRAEAARRKTIPLTPDEEGRLRKVIYNKSAGQESSEQQDRR